MNSQYSRVVISQLWTGSRCYQQSYLGGSPAPGHGRQDRASSLLSHGPSVSASPITQGQRTEEAHPPAGGGGTGSPALSADAAGAAFDLTVDVQQARVVALGLLCADLRERGQMAVGLMTKNQLSPPSSDSLLRAFTHRPLGNVIRPDVGPTGSWLFTGPASSGQIGQNKELGHPSLPHPPPAPQKPALTAGHHSRSIGGSRLYLGSWWHTTADGCFWLRSDLCEGLVSFCHFTNVAKVS